MNAGRAITSWLYGGWTSPLRIVMVDETASKKGKKGPKRFYQVQSTKNARLARSIPRATEVASAPVTLQNRGRSMKEKREDEKERKILYLQEDSGRVDSLLRVPSSNLSLSRRNLTDTDLPWWHMTCDKYVAAVTNMRGVTTR